jgi:hypothetical protein
VNFDSRASFIDATIMIHCSLIEGITSDKDMRGGVAKSTGDQPYQKYCFTRIEDRMHLLCLYFAVKQITSSVSLFCCKTNQWELVPPVPFFLLHPYGAPCSCSLLNFKN